MTKSALILGGSGRFGRHATAALTQAGWSVKAFRRGQDELANAAQNVDVIVNGWNPPYPRWAKDIATYTAEVIAAAQASGARVVVPGNLYVYGANAPALLERGTPHAARNPLGRIRVEMEAAYRQAGIKLLILRAGDFLDTEASGNWFDRILAAKIERGRLAYPGAANVPHAWAFLPDMAAAMVGLLEQEAALPEVCEVEFEGYTLTGEQLAAACARVLGRPVQITRSPWWPIQLASPLWPLGRHLLEMRYLWDMPHRVDGSELKRWLPDFQPTPPEEALRQALKFKINPDQPVTGDLALPSTE